MSDVDENKSKSTLNIRLTSKQSGYSEAYFIPGPEIQSNFLIIPAGPKAIFCQHDFPEHKRNYSHQLQHFRLISGSGTVEEGATWIHGRKGNRLYELIQQAGISTTEW